MIYEYKCNSCKQEFLFEQKITEKPLDLCPFCESEDCHKLISKNSFILKGKGWAKDGYG